MNTSDERGSDVARAVQTVAEEQLPPETSDRIVERIHAQFLIIHVAEHHWFVFAKSLREALSLIFGLLGKGKDTEEEP